MYVIIRLFIFISLKNTKKKRPTEYLIVLNSGIYYKMEIHHIPPLICLIVKTGSVFGDGS